MKLRPDFAFLLLLLTLLLGYNSCAAAAEQPYTNADLSNYKGDNGGTVIGDRPLPEGREKKGSPKNKDEKSQQYWCSKGTAYKNQIDKSKTKVDDAERNLSILDSQGPDGKRSKDRKKSHSAAEKKLRNAKKELSRSEEELAQFEQKAHRQNIPPGWLRCQFHY